jgi:hypothetical protein
MACLARLEQSDACRPSAASPNRHRRVPGRRQQRRVTRDGRYTSEAAAEQQRRCPLLLDEQHHHQHQHTEVARIRWAEKTAPVVEGDQAAESSVQPPNGAGARGS